MSSIISGKNFILIDTLVKSSNHLQIDKTVLYTLYKFYLVKTNYFYFRLKNFLIIIFFHVLN